MKKETLFDLSSMPKLILAVVLIVCIGAVTGLMGWALTKKQIGVETPEEIIKDETVDWQIYSSSQSSFTFKYPENWEIIDDYFYETAVGFKAKNKTVIIKLSGSENLETININMSQVANNYNPKTCEYKDLCEGNYIATCGKELRTIEVYYQVINSFQCVDVKDETADWQIYRNEEYGFKVKYPEDLLVEEINKEYINLWTRDGYNEYKRKNTTASPYFWVTCNTLDALTLEEWISKKDTMQEDKKYITFRDNRFLKIFEPGYAGGTEIYYLDNGKGVVAIGTHKNKEKDSLFNQILSSFKFTEK